jgi:hypothetical protein
MGRIVGSAALAVGSKIRMWKLAGGVEAAQLKMSLRRTSIPT